MNNDSQHRWIIEAKARGLGSALRVAFDALEPLGPLGAQVLWILQPTAGIFGGKSARHAVADVARALETPDGLESLREQLARDDDEES